MKRMSKPLLRSLSVGVLAVTLLLAQPGMPAEASIGYTEAQKKAVQEQIENNKNKLAQLQNELNNMKNQSASAMDQKTQIDAQMMALQENIDLTDSLIEEYETGIQEKIKEIAVRQTEVDTKYEQLKEQLRLSYENGSSNYLEILFSSDSLGDMLTRIERMRSMASYQDEQMCALEEEAEYLEQLREKLENDLAEQETLKVTLVQNKAELNDKAAEADQTLSQLMNNSAERQRQIEEIKKADEECQAKLLAIIKDLELQAREAEEQAKAQGAYMWPVNKSHTWISSDFGWRIHPIYGVTGFHNGIDIPARLGEPVYASNNGTVIVAEYNNSYGNYVVIDHGNGIQTLYAHNSLLCVKVGQKVTKGDVIAKIGSTGDSTGCHCHFEIRVNGKRVHPLDKNNAQGAFVTVPS